MRNLIGFVLVAIVLSLSGLIPFAIAKQHTSKVYTTQTEIKGQVTKLSGQALMVKDEAGKIHLVKVSNPKALERLKVGDNVDVRFQNGKMLSMQKIEGITYSQPASGTK